MVGYWTHRTWCDCLEELRKIMQYQDFIAKPTVLSLIEELQTFGNRMEAGLDYKGDLKDLHEQRSKLMKEIKKLKADNNIPEED